MNAIITAVAVFIISSVCFIISVRHFLEKGVPFNNVYLYATKEEREKTDKKPLFRQSAVCFALIGTVFCLIGVEALTQIDAFLWISLGVTAITLVYAVVSSVRIEKK